MNGLANILLAAVLLVGVYCPTSIAGQQLRWLWAAPGFVLVAVLALLTLWYGMLKWAFVCCAVGMASLLFFTMITPLWSITAGTLLPHAALMVLLCTDLSKVSYEWPLRISWSVMNIVNIALSALVIADFQPAKEFLTRYYSAFYDALVPDMLSAGKPVLTFGSHSIAAFFFFVCFYLHLKTFTVKRSNWSLLSAIIYILLLLALKCVSAFLLFPAALGLLIYHTRGRRALALAVCLLLATVVAAIVIPGAQWDQITANLVKIGTAPESGFQGRYFGTGTLVHDLAYIAAHPWQGIGFGYSDLLWYGDSGPVELLLRGSPLLLFAIYGAFWLFLRDSLLSKKTAITVFLIYLGFEIAYSNLLYLRTVCVLPLVIVYLNALAPRRVASAGPAVARCELAPVTAGLPVCCE
jgi:hypothetical protein